MKDLKDAIEKGTKAWADVPDATEWVEELRGNETEKQEPVAWMTINEYGEEDDIHYENPEGHLLEGWTYKPLYTHPPSVQPEGWVKIDEVREHFNSVGCGTIYKTAGEDRVPLYTTPPAAQRTWVGLDKETMRNTTLQFNQGALWAERYLKEKNT